MPKKIDKTEAEKLQLVAEYKLNGNAPMIAQRAGIAGSTILNWAKTLDPEKVALAIQITEALDGEEKRLIGSTVVEKIDNFIGMLLEMLLERLSEGVDETPIMLETFSVVTTFRSQTMITGLSKEIRDQAITTGLEFTLEQSAEAIDTFATEEAEAMQGEESIG